LDIPYFRSKGFYASGVHTDCSQYSVFCNKEKLSGVRDFDKQFFALPSGWWVSKKELNNLGETIKN
jgi:hypothetical protein